MIYQNQAETVANRMTDKRAQQLRHWFAHRDAKDFMVLAERTQLLTEVYLTGKTPKPYKDFSKLELARKVIDTAEDLGTIANFIGTDGIFSVGMFLAHGDGQP